MPAGHGDGRMNFRALRNPAPSSGTRSCRNGRICSAPPARFERRQMKIARFNDNRIGVVRGETIVDVTDIVGGDPGAWPPVAMNRLIAEFGEYRGKLDRAPAGKGIALNSVKLL